ncbi:hypothetical protein RI367_002254 [Sorochytrium milnesiophthora]
MTIAGAALERTILVFVKQDQRSGRLWTLHNCPLPKNVFVVCFDSYDNVGGLVCDYGQASSQDPFDDLYISSPSDMYDKPTRLYIVSQPDVDFAAWLKDRDMVVELDIDFLCIGIDVEPILPLLKPQRRVWVANDDADLVYVLTHLLSEEQLTGLREDIDNLCGSLKLLNPAEDVVFSRVIEMHFQHIHFKFDYFVSLLHLTKSGILGAIPYDDDRQELISLYLDFGIPYRVMPDAMETLKVMLSSQQDVRSLAYCLDETYHCPVLVTAQFNEGIGQQRSRATTMTTAPMPPLLTYPEPTPDSPPSAHEDSEDVALKNYIGLLQTHCQCHHLPMPVYEEKMVSAKPILFTCTVTMGSMQAATKEPCIKKKDAKHAAAAAFIAKYGIGITPASPVSPPTSAASVPDLPIASRVSVKPHQRPLLPSNGTGPNPWLTNLQPAIVLNPEVLASQRQPKVLPPASSSSTPSPAHIPPPAAHPPTRPTAARGPVSATAAAAFASVPKPVETKAGLDPVSDLYNHCSRARIPKPVFSDSRAAAEREPRLRFGYEVLVDGRQYSVPTVYMNKSEAKSAVASIALADILGETSSHHAGSSSDYTPNTRSGGGSGAGGDGSSSGDPAFRYPGPARSLSPSRHNALKKLFTTPRGPAASQSASAQPTRLYISELYELCVHNGYPLPVYDAMYVSGQDFLGRVTIGECTVLGQVRCKRKKEADADAARMMLQEIDRHCGYNGDQ